ncbi:MAG: Serine/threonine-protein kinase PrkC [Chloroflexi bacterium ADurb.Bin344]|nr:MAG: Serine/threonine-protein kinase PrkC [Chloroflexi bacterium ADurb.Bin344]
MGNSEHGFPFSIGDKFQDYRLITLAGSGAYGSVYQAEDLIGKLVALKIIFLPGAGKNYERELNGLREYRTHVPTHPHLLQIYHIGEADGYFYYTMELADNLSREKDVYLPATLKNQIFADGPLTLQNLKAIGEPLCGAIDALHQAGLLHRDIKPDNIVFVNGCPKLGDIGLVASLRGDMSFAGTMGFFPPEMLSGKNTLEKANDVYALGKVLYMALTGEPVENFPTFPPGLPLNCKYIRRVLLQACASDPQKRYQSAKAFSLAFTTAIDMDVQQGTRISAEELLSLPLRYDNSGKMVREILRDEIIIPCEAAKNKKLNSLKCTMWFVVLPVILVAPLAVYSMPFILLIFWGLNLLAWSVSFFLLSRGIQRMHIQKAAEWFDVIFGFQNKEAKQTLAQLAESPKAFSFELNKYITLRQE